MDAPTFIGFLFLSGLDTEEKGSRLLSHRHRAVGFVLHSLSDIERIGRNIEFQRCKLRISEGIDHALAVLQHAADFSYERDITTNTLYIR